MRYFYFPILFSYFPNLPVNIPDPFLVPDLVDVVLIFGLFNFPETS